MNPDVALTLTAAAANLSMAALHFAVARAPGWRITRWFGGMALTAGVYSLLNVIYCVPALSATVYLTSGRFSHLLGTVQTPVTIAWAGLTYYYAETTWLGDACSWSKATSTRF